MLTREHQGKRIHVEFKDGESADLRVLVVSECDEHENCRGISYDVISTNRPERLRPGSAYWADMVNIKSFEVLRINKCNRSQRTREK
jgi:hypothetical protein